MNSPTVGYRLYAGLALISMAVLMLEVTLTRVFSVSIWYHFAFMVVSIALLGFGASGALVTVARRLDQVPLERFLPVASLLFALSALIALIVAATVPFDPFLLQSALLAQLLFLAIYYLAMSAPFFFAGVAIALILKRLTSNVSQLYFADLVGAGSGCLLVIAVLPLVGPQGAIVLSAALGVVAGLLFGAHQDHRWLMALLGFAVVLGLSTPFAGHVVDVHIPVSKGLRSSLQAHQTARLLSTDWNSFSRVDVTEGDLNGYAPGISDRERFDIPPQLAVRIDADALTPITRFDGDATRLRYVEHVPSSLAYQVLDRPAVLIIGAGGGPDVLTALHYDARAVTGVELNPIIVSLVRDRHADFAGQLYRDPRVSITVDEGRNFVSRSADRYDLIQLSLVDTWAAVSSGAYSLAENYLYTKEAFLAYYDHLTDQGMVTMTRWYGAPPLETIRLLTTASAALAERGIASPAAHFLVIRQGNLATTAVKRQPFQPAEVARLSEFADANGFELLYAPAIAGVTPPLASSNPVAGFFSAPDRAAFIATVRYNVSPVTDDNPFFFQFGRWGDFLNLADLPRLAGDHSLVGYMLLIVVLAQALLFAAALIWLPLRRLSAASGPPHGRLYLLAYFAALGIGFMFIEIVLMQKLMLFLGYPVYAVALVLATLLISSGFGSLLTRNVQRAPHRRITLVVLMLSVVMAVELLALPVLTERALGQPIAIRMALSVLVVAPVGLLLGMPFPLGLRLVHQTAPGLVPWAWGVNGCASVLGPILAVMVAMGSGYNVVLLLATGVYLLAMVAALVYHGSTRSASAKTEPGGAVT